MSVTAFLMLALLFSTGFYLILCRRYSDVIFGITLLSNGVNLLLIQSAQEGGDPLPQALILTAIVIGFALIAFFTAYIMVCKEENK